MKFETPLNPYSEDWHGFHIQGCPGQIGHCFAYLCRVSRRHNRVFEFHGRVVAGDALEAALEQQVDELNPKRVALARVRAIIDLRSFTEGETIERRLFDLKTSGMPRDELRRRLLGVFYTLFKELPGTYERAAVDGEGLWMELRVSENECTSELNYLTGKGWLEHSRVRTGLLDLCITVDGIDEYLSLATPPSTRDIFICYRGDDTGRHKDPLGDKLKLSLGEDSVFIAPWDVGPGFWHDEILTTVRVCKVMLVLIGPRWLTIKDDDGGRRLDNPEDIVRLEIETAFAQGKTVVPVLFEGVQMPADEDLPESSLRRLPDCQRYTIDPDRWKADTDELIKALKVALNRPPAQGV